MSDLRGMTALLGGSFDPPHIAHAMACLYLLEGLRADEVWLLPTFAHPLKRAQASFADRMAMCTAMARALGPRVTVHDTEGRKDATGFTIDTVRFLQGSYPSRRFALVIGADLLPETSRWHRFDELRRLIDIVVLGRPGAPEPRTGVVLPDVSSSAVREKLARGESIGGLVPAGVLDYIEAHQLYTEAASTPSL